MHKFFLTIGVFFSLVIRLHAQAPVKGLDIGLNYQVECSCADSNGNIYAITRTSIEDESDSMALFFFNVQLQKWSLISSLGKVYSSLGARAGFFPYKSFCNLLKGKLYFTSNFYDYYFSNTEFRTVLYTITLSGTWSLMTEFNGYNVGSVSTYKYNNQLYFIGSFDTLGSLNMPGKAAVYDGVNFASTSLPINYFFSGISTVTGMGPTFETISDTLLISSGPYVYYHVYPNKWGIYYTSINQLNIGNIAGSGSLLYILYGRTFDVVSNGVRIDSFSYSQPGNAFYYSRNKMFKYKDRIYVKDYGILYCLKGLKELNPLLNISGIDTTNKFEFLNDNNSKLYYHSKNGVFYNGTDFHNIAEIITDSLKETSFDTVIVKAYRDHNKNNVMDNKEPLSPYCNFSYNSFVFNTDANGVYTLYPLDNEDMKIYFVSESVQDSCFKTYFSGGLSSTCYKSSKNKDKLEFPLRRTSLQNRNLILRSYGYFNERIGDTTPLRIRIFNRDCDYNTASVIVNVTLDTNTNFVSSNPAFTSRQGNVLTYNLNNIEPYNNVENIKLNVAYPYGKYSIGQKVRHHVKLFTAFAEDTMDNADSIVQVMVYSRDPNAKHSIPEGRVTKDLKSIRYRIDFQNEGNDDARRVTIIDTLNLKLPVYEFQMIGCSHTYSVSLRGNVVTWVFENINLKPKGVNDALSKGFVVFEAKLRKALRNGDSIFNKAAIYFDYNAPIFTGKATVLVDLGDDGSKDLSIVNSVKVFPNPTQNYLHFQNQSSYIQYLTIYDAKGAKMNELILEERELNTISTLSWAKGIYIIVNAYGKGIKIIVE